MDCDEVAAGVERKRECDDVEADCIEKNERCLVVSTAVVFVHITALGLSSRTRTCGALHVEMISAATSGQNFSNKRG